MAAPNIVNVSTITGKTTAISLSSINPTLIVENVADSSKIFKINSLYVTNTSTAVQAISVLYYPLANIGGTGVALAWSIPIPVNATITVVTKDTAIYLEENTSLGAIASVANNIKVICSYEEIA